MSLAQSAAIEALEEAGVMGETAPDPIGRYHYLKEKNGSALPCAVEVFSLFVTGEQPSWAEKDKRQKLWLPAERAAAKVAETGLRRILTGFARARKAA